MMESEATGEERFRLLSCDGERRNVFIVHNSNRPMAVRCSHGSPSSRRRFFSMSLRKHFPFCPASRKCIGKLHERTFVGTAIVDYGSRLHSIFIDIFFCFCYHLRNVFAFSPLSMEFSSSHILMSPRASDERKKEIT